MPCVCVRCPFRCACSLFFLFYWANDSVGKNEGADTTTRTEIETAGSGKIWVSGFGPWEPAAASAAPTNASGAHPAIAAVTDICNPWFVRV